MWRRAYFCGCRQATNRGQQCGSYLYRRGHQRGARSAAEKKYRGKRTSGFGVGRGFAGTRIAAGSRGSEQPVGGLAASGAWRTEPAGCGDVHAALCGRAGQSRGCNADAYIAGGGGSDATPGASEAEEAARRDGTGEPMKNQEEMLDKAIETMRATDAGSRCNFRFCREGCGKAGDRVCGRRSH